MKFDEFYVGQVIEMLEFEATGMFKLEVEQ